MGGCRQGFSSMGNYTKYATRRENPKVILSSDLKYSCEELSFHCSCCICIVGWKAFMYFPTSLVPMLRDSNCPSEPLRSQWVGKANYL